MAVARRKRESERGSLDEVVAPDGSRREGWQGWAKANAWPPLDVLLESRRRRRAWYGTANQTDAAIDATEIINVSEGKTTDGTF